MLTAVARPLAVQKKAQAKAAEAALDMVLFKEAKKKNELKKAAEMACQAKKVKEKEPEKRDIYVDEREQKEKDRAPPPAPLNALQRWGGRSASWLVGAQSWRTGTRRRSSKRRRL